MFGSFWRHVLVVTTRKNLLVSSGRGPAILLSSLRCTEQPLPQNHLAPNVMVSRLRNPGFHSPHELMPAFWCLVSRSAASAMLSAPQSQSLCACSPLGWNTPSLDPCISVSSLRRCQVKPHLVGEASRIQGCLRHPTPSHCVTLAPFCLLCRLYRYFVILMCVCCWLLLSTIVSSSEAFPVHCHPSASTRHLAE